MNPLPPFEPDLKRASTLSARWYTDPDIADLERRRIFARTWQPVGRVDQLQKAGDFFTCEAVGEPLVVVRDTRGELRGYYNVCRHRAGAVATGTGCRKTLQCQYHGWTYGLDGRLIAAMEMDGVEGFDRADFGLMPVRVAAWGPFIFANLDDKAPPLIEFLGDIDQEMQGRRLETMKWCRRRDYDVYCNWKVYIDNFLEAYHVPVAHKGLNRELDYPNYRVVTHRYHSTQYAPIRPGKTASGPRRYGDTDGSSQALYCWVFPNWMLNVYPDNISLNIVLPTAIDRCVTVFEWYFHDPERPEVQAALERTVAFSDEIQLEDIKLCEDVQARLGSRAYDRGRFSVLRENGVHHFQGLVHEFLTRE